MTRRRLRTAPALALLVLPAASCHVILGFDDYQVGGGSGGGAGGAGDGGAGGGGSGTGAGPATSGGGGGAGPACGDGQVTGDEQCDDANQQNGDGCSASCGYELSDGCPAVALALGTTQIAFQGNTMGTAADAQATCGGMSSGEYIFQIQPAIGGQLVAVLDAQYNAVLWARDACPAGVELGCATGAMPLQLSLAVTPGQSVFLAVDGYQAATGTFTLTLVIAP